MHYVRCDQSARNFDAVQRMILDYAHATSGVPTPMDVGSFETPAGNQDMDQEWFNWYENVPDETRRAWTRCKGREARRKAKEGTKEGGRQAL